VQINNTSNGRGAIETQTNGSGQALLATAASRSGVEGHSRTGAGVLGVADASTATALQAQGKTVLSGPTTLGGKTTFARSGRLTIFAATSQATKSSISLSTASSVLATVLRDHPL